MNKKLLSKSLVIGIIVIFIGAGVIPSRGITFEEKPIIPIINGKTLYVGGDGPDNYTKIQDAVDDARDGDTVFVYDDSAPYYEHVIVDEEIDLIGENKTSTFILGWDWGYVVTIFTDGAKVSGFTISFSFDYYGGAISIDSGINNIIKGNNLRRSYNGIHLSNSYNNTIIENNIWDCYNHGINFLNSNNNYVTGNNIKSNVNMGMSISSSNNNNIVDNTFSYNRHDIELRESSVNNTISGNKFSNTICPCTNIDIRDSTCNTIIYNMIMTSSTLNIHNSSNNSIIGNTIYNSEMPYITELSNNNLIANNNFIHYKDRAYDEGNNSWNRAYPLGGNYWDGYTGSDDFSGPNQDIPGSDGIGDTAYPISGDNNKDNYPLMEPWGIENHPPTVKKIDGPTRGKVGIDYNYSFFAADPDGDDVFYYIDWGDGINTTWIGPYAVDENIIINHTWVDGGEYKIRAKVKDIWGNESQWKIFIVNMPKNKRSYNVKFPLLFDSLQFFMCLLLEIWRGY